MSNLFEEVDMMGIIKRPDVCERKWTWLPKQMSSRKLKIGYYYECTYYRSQADPRHTYWIKKYYTEKEQFLKKLTNQI